MAVHSSEVAGTEVQAEEFAAFRTREWVVANGLGLALVYALAALLSGLVEAAGAHHESLVRDLAGLTGFLIGAAVFTFLRYRVIAGRVRWSFHIAVGSGLALAAGFAIGFLIAGPPIDFVLGIIALGSIGGGLQWRRLRDRIQRPGGLLAIGIIGWVVASVVAVAFAIAFGDAIDAAVGSGVAGFVAVTGSIGLIGGAVGGAIEGRALKDRLSG